MVQFILLSRHSYSYGKTIIKYEKILKRELTKEEEDYMNGELTESFLKLKGKILVLGPEDIISYNKQSIKALYKEIDELLDNFSAIVWDHVNLFKYIDSSGKMTGDHYIKMLTEIGISFENKNKNKITTGLAVQVNRQGWTRAKKKEGRYDMLALSEFNELERSCTYVVFLFSSPYMRNVHEMKVLLAKNRIGGGVMEDPVVTTFIPEYSVIGEQFTETKRGGDMSFDILNEGLTGF